MQELLESYKRKVEALKEMMNGIQKPNNTSRNPDYVRLQTKMNCYRHFVNELERLLKEQIDYENF